MKCLQKYFVFFLCLCILFSCTACSNRKNTPQEKTYHSFFDTISYVYSYKNDTKKEFEENAGNVSDILKEYHKLFDIYNEYPNISNLCTVNKNAGIKPTEVDKKLIDFMLYAKEMYSLTNGKLNVMMGSVLSLWHNAKNTSTIPSLQLLKDANEHTDFSLLKIDETNNTLYITDANASLDVGALGKGYATEMAANFLEQNGVTSYVLNIGGNIRIIGTKPDGSGWITGIKNPDKSNSEMAEYLDLSDVSCVTSGSYERFFTVESKKYHHIIDPQTLMPSDKFSSVSVITKHSGLADALSTALFCMDYKNGVSLVNSLDGVEALWITSDGQILYSKNMQSYVSKNH